VLMTNEGKNRMAELVSSAELVPISPLTSVTGHQLLNVAPADAVGLNVLSPFLARPDTSTFELSGPVDSSTTVVVREATADGGQGLPVVLHKVVVP
jgi:hypothetical protein